MHIGSRIIAVLLALCASVGGVTAGGVSVAVAANFASVADELAAQFRAASGHTVAISTGSTGSLYAQITQGAPYDVFLAADAAHVQQAVAGGYGVADSAFTYAMGKLVLYAPAGGPVAGREVLMTAAFAHLAIADPALAPYGAAAEETLAALGLSARLAPTLVRGTSVSQALQFVESGNAELGFVALSQVLDRPAGSYWVVPDTLYAPIRQDAVLLTHAADNSAAREFMAFLRSAAAQDVIAARGYGRGESLP